MLAVAVHDGPFETENTPAARHDLKCELIWLTLLMALVTATLKFWMVAWICEVWFATCCWIWASVKQ
jgi:hypothetical protein